MSNNAPLPPTLSYHILICGIAQILTSLGNLLELGLMMAYILVG